MSTFGRLSGLVVGVLALFAASCTSDPSPAGPAVSTAIETAVTQPTEIPAEPTEPTDVESAVAPAGSRQQPRGLEPANYQSIRDVDFMNGFTITAGLERQQEVTLVDGSFENGAFGDPDYFRISIRDVNFSDLDGDGSEEAMLVASWNGGGTGVFDSVRAFRLIDGRVEPAGVVLFGDRADGGVFDLGIENDMVSAWSFSTTLGACCPDQVTRNTLALDDQSLVLAERGVARTWMSLDSSPDLDDELKFLPGTSSAMVAIYGFHTSGDFTFDAAAGQQLSVTHVNGPVPDGISVISPTGEAIADIADTADIADLVLPADGLYQVEVRFDGERSETTVFDVVINDG